MALFINDYSGSPLHMLRNGKPLSLQGSYIAQGVVISHVSLLPFNSGSNVFVYDNVTVSGTNRTIVASGHNSAHKPIYNFVISLQGTAGENKQVVVYVHDTLNEIWLNPGKMSIRNGCDQIRFAVMARFTESGSSPALVTMADITEMMGVFEWSKPTGAPGALTVGGDGRITVSGTLSGPYPKELGVCVKVVLKEDTPLYKAGIEATGELVAYDSKGSLVLDGTVADNVYQEKSNYLIIADGFTQDESDVFDTYASDIIRQMRSDPCSSPWNLFSPKLNFWKYFIPSLDDGGILNDEYVITQRPATGSNLKATSIDSYLKVAKYILETLNNYSRPGIKSVLLQTLKAMGQEELALQLNSTIMGLTDPVITPDPANQKPYLGANVLSLERVLQMTQYPTLNDKNVMTGATSLVTVRDAQLAKWKLIDSGIPMQKDNPNAADYFHILIYQLWAFFGERVYLEYKDTAWGTFEGRSLNINVRKEKELGNEILDQHTNKIYDKKKFNKIISELTYSSTNVPVGQQFFKLVGTDYKPQKDANNIIILTKTLTNQFFGLTIPGKEAPATPDDNPEDTIGSRRTSSAYDKVYSTISITETLANKKYTVDVISLKEAGKPKPMSFLARGAAIHELSHNWLLDEYGGDKTADDLSSQDSQYLFLSEIKRSNLAQDFTQTFTKMVDTLNWRLPRIIKVGILAEGLTGSGTSYTVKVKISDIALAEGTKPFEKEMVYLRGPELFKFPAVTKPSGTTEYIINCPKFKIDSISDNTTTKIRTFNLTYQNNIGNITNSNFDKKSIIFVPRTVVVDNVEKVLELIHSDVREKIKAAGRPVAYERSDPRAPQPPRISISDVLSTYIKSLKKPVPLIRMVGVFEGGREFNEHVYHPTGFCAMRSVIEQSDATKWVNSANQAYTANYFCPVCQYILASNIDPLQLPALDDKYQSDYPSTEQ